MVAISLAALCVFIFSAYAYGATTPVVLTLCSVCTVWFALHAFAEFRILLGYERFRGIPDLVALILTYAFPPLITHNVLQETAADCKDPTWTRRWGPPVWGLYVVSLLGPSSCCAASTASC
jgi:hypothetical protein